MSAIQSNGNQVKTVYTAPKMSHQTDPSPSGNKLIGFFKNQWDQNGRLKFVIVALGIFISYLLVGILQENIMKTRYGEDKEKFTYANTLVEVSLVSGLIFINIWIFFQPQRKDTTPFGYYVVSAIANIVAMVTSYMALRWVSFPTQVIFKSGKPISVMFCGLLICKRYTIQRYFFVIAIVAGVIIFNLFEPKKAVASKSQSAPPTGSDQGKFGFDFNDLSSDAQRYMGIGLLCLSLAMDGILGMIQDKIRAAHKPTSQHMMLSMSIWGSGILLIVLIATWEIVGVYEFACRHPQVLWQMAVFGVAGAVGQMFIYTMVSSFGPLANSVTTTVRKFFSVVFSIIFFGHASSLIQWTGAALVFSALLADAFFGRKQLPCLKKKQTSSELPTAPANVETKESVPETKVTVTETTETVPETKETIPQQVEQETV